MVQARESGARTIAEIVRRAQQRLPAHYWSHAAGGVGSETTLRRNRVMMESLAFRPRLMQGSDAVDIRTTVLGLELDSPVMFAPIGTIELFSEAGAIAPASVAADRKLISFYSVMAWPAIREVAGSGAGRLVLQIYVRGGDRAWLEDVVRAAEAEGYLALCVTVDSIGGGTRDRQLLDDFSELRTLRRPNVAAAAPAPAGRRLAFGWEDLDWLKSITSLPVMLKGITVAADAVEAVRHHVDCIYVSNHGGRSLDSLPAALEVLPEIVEAVEGQAEIIVDGGFMRGADIVKAVALGARAVALGKLQAWALGAGGESWLTRAVEILETEIGETVQLLGAQRLADLSPAHLRPALPTRYYVDDLNRYRWESMPQV